MRGKSVVDKSFVVLAPSEVAWNHLAKVEQWPGWAKHIRSEVDERVAQEARNAGFQGALSQGDGIFALSQAVEALLQGKTFFFPALPTSMMAEANAPASGVKEEPATTEEAKSGKPPEPS